MCCTTRETSCQTLTTDRLTLVTVTLLTVSRNVQRQHTRWEWVDCFRSNLRKFGLLNSRIPPTEETVSKLRSLCHEVSTTSR